MSEKSKLKEGEQWVSSRCVPVCGVIFCTPHPSESCAGKKMLPIDCRANNHLVPSLFSFLFLLSLLSSMFHSSWNRMTISVRLWGNNCTLIYRLNYDCKPLILWIIITRLCFLAVCVICLLREPLASSLFTQTHRQNMRRWSVHFGVRIYVVRGCGKQQQMQT